MVQVLYPLTPHCVYLRFIFTKSNNFEKIEATFKNKFIWTDLRYSISYFRTSLPVYLSYSHWIYLNFTHISVFFLCFKLQFLKLLFAVTASLIRNTKFLIQLIYPCSIFSCNFVISPFILGFPSMFPLRVPWECCFLAINSEIIPATYLCAISFSYSFLSFNQIPLFFLCKSCENILS